MAFDVVEKFDSRRVVLSKDSESATLEYVGYGSDDDAVARAGFDLAAPGTFTAFTNPLARLDVEVFTLGGLFWRATAHYGPDRAPLYPAVGGAGRPTPVAAAPGPYTPLGPDYAFDFTGVTEHVTQSKETVIGAAIDVAGAATAAPGTNGAIGATADGQVEGCDRIAPNLEWSRTVTFASVTMDYIRLLVSLVGTVNNNTFYNRPKGSCLFLGGNCQIDDTRRAKVTFKFLDRPNEKDIKVRSDWPDATKVAKEGHQYLWVAYRDMPSANKLTQQPYAVYVERIYDYADWSQMRIGV